MDCVFVYTLLILLLKSGVKCVANKLRNIRYYIVTIKRKRWTNPPPLESLPSVWRWWNWRVYCFGDGEGDGVRGRDCCSGCLLLDCIANEYDSLGCTVLLCFKSQNVVSLFIIPKPNILITWYTRVGIYSLRDILYWCKLVNVCLFFLIKSSRERV